jgi:hypothetical protein
LAVVILRRGRAHQVLVLWQQESDQRDHDHRHQGEVAQAVLLLAEELAELDVVEMRGSVGQLHQVRQVFALTEL